MADRYQDKPFPPYDDYDRGIDEPMPARDESDPLAELARLIGHTDPVANDGPPAGPPSWMRHVARQPQHDDQDLDPGRYDEALYGQLDPGEQETQQNAGYGGEDYAYQDDYGEEDAEDPPQRPRGRLVTVVAIVALAVVGTGAAFAYRTYIGAARRGEPPIIKADTGPTKIVPAPADGSTKLPDRIAPGDGTEKLVRREETPVDIGAQTGPRVVLPPLTTNASLPPVAGAGPAVLPPAGNSTLSSSEPRKVKTLAVRSDQPDAAAEPVASAPKPAPAPMPRVSTSVPAVPRTSSPPPPVGANAPISLVPQAAQPAPAAEPRTRVAATSSPVQAAPSGGSGYLVQVSSQKNEADAQASFRVLQSKFPGVLGSRTALIRRADLGDKGVYYRALVGPFDSSDEAAQFCSSLKTAGGQCVVQRN